jgi:hypothetical protein
MTTSKNFRPFQNSFGLLLRQSLVQSLDQSQCLAENKMIGFKEYLSEEVNLSDFPEGVFGDLPVEKKSENSRTAVFVVKSKDIPKDKEKILGNLLRAGERVSGDYGKMRIRVNPKVLRGEKGISKKIINIDFKKG